MIDVDLTTAKRLIYEADLRQSHQMRVRIENMTLSQTEPRDISDRLLDGQVTVNAVAEVSTRTLNITLLDPDATLGFDSGDPSDGVMFADRMLRVYYGIYSRGLSRWVDVPIFTGPVTSLDRSGAVLTLQASSKEMLALEVWSGFTIPKGTNKISAIKAVMNRAGERSYKTTATKSKLGAKMSIAFPQMYWQIAKSIASTIDQQIFYDGLGRLRTRKLGQTSIFSFESGNGGAILSDPQVTYNPDTLKNVIRVVGKKPKKGKTPAYNAHAPSAHPLSARSLGRNGVPRYLQARFQSDSYRTVAECQKRATTILNSRLLETIEVKFDSLVIPHLEPNDLCRVTTDKMNLVFRLREFTIPLTPGGAMTVGYVRKHKITSTQRKDLRRRIK